MNQDLSSVKINEIRENLRRYLFFTDRNDVIYLELAYAIFERDMTCRAVLLRLSDYEDKTGKGIALYEVKAAGCKNNSLKLYSYDYFGFYFHHAHQGAKRFDAKIRLVQGDCRNIMAFLPLNGNCDLLRDAAKRKVTHDFKILGAAGNFYRFKADSRKFLSA